MIEFRNVNVSYKKGVRALKNIDLKVNDGEFLFVVGPSGAGKSTLLRLLTRELTADSGRVLVRGVDIGELKNRYIPKYRRNLGVVFQDFRLLKDRNVYENIAFAGIVTAMPKDELKDRTADMLRLVGLSAKYKYMPDELSGGEAERVAIARALINEPAIILADEPTGNLDLDNSMEILDLLLKVNSMGTTVIFITHSHELLARADKRVVELRKGEIISDLGSKDEGIDMSFTKGATRERETLRPGRSRHE